MTETRTAFGQSWTFRVFANSLENKSKKAEKNVGNRFETLLNIINPYGQELIRSSHMCALHIIICLEYRASKTNKVDRAASRITYTGLLDRPAGRTNSIYLKPWPVCIFEDWLFSLFIVTYSESNEGLVLLMVMVGDGPFVKKS